MEVDQIKGGKSKGGKGQDTQNCKACGKAHQGKCWYKDKESASPKEKEKAPKSAKEKARTQSLPRKSVRSAGKPTTLQTSVIKGSKRKTRKDHESRQQMLVLATLLGQAPAVR